MVIRQADVVKCVDNAERKVPPLRLASPHYGRDDSGVKAALRCWQKKRVLRCAQEDKRLNDGRWLLDVSAGCCDPFGGEGYVDVHRAIGVCGRHVHRSFRVLGRG